ncbi:sulfatase family protein [Botryobacter ruber]|uniref:sulfatase family protein n=1 Tax=Botryobacter ruber TaxID=2171629 RepID=UPI000E0C55F4|nr:sulfatase [Botryobacter ruber]
MKRLRFLKKAGAVAACIGGAVAASLFHVPAAQAQAKTQQKPNIIFIMSDDHALQAISAYSPDLIKTPNIDRIAQEGALLRNAFVTNSICGPSRAVILTGKYSHINGFTDNQDRFNSKQQTFPHLLKANGYSTAIVGKWHLNSTPDGFDYWNILPGQGDYYNPRFINMGQDTVYNGYVTDVTTDLALSWIDAHKQKPFMLMLHQKAPHRNQMPPLENLELFNDRKFPMPASFYDDYKDRPALQRQQISMRNNLDIDHDTKVPCNGCTPKKGEKWAPRNYMREINRMTPQQREVWNKAYRKEQEEFAKLKTTEERVKWQYQRYMEDYLRCIKSVDDNVGRVLQYLEANGLADNTIIIYTSDQGAYLGEHGLYDKRFMYEESLRTPMMIRYPAGIKPAQKVNEYVLNLDIGPTLLDFAGIQVPGDMQGESMKQVLTGQPVNNWRDKIYYHYYGKSFGLTAHYGIRTSQYKLIRFYDPISTWELYDLAKDPQEMKNLYNDPKYAKVAAKLKAELAELQQKYKDPQPLANK